MALRSVEGSGLGNGHFAVLVRVSLMGGGIEGKVYPLIPHLYEPLKVVDSRVMPKDFARAQLKVTEVSLTI